ncbi:hypothetical protein OIDMADRAFT_134370 [Oidiodendron maius Zn]|uniref:Zn(2)-C6 fungal-type domain-containing protein n=1 Tax=Oidiodendron maius (strain Zn) TaxID=913774 RepID=A0A0C3CZW7_OIDMZ|nr:hypothetical protein OIDMADRAFT_134370 [Oidiodendron maius Zn]
MNVAKVTVDKILLFGDSITEQSYNQEYGFNLAPALQHEYFRKLQVVVRGYGGYNTEHARYILNPTLDTEAAGGSKIRLLVVFFGTNDSAQNALQHVPLGRYAENVHLLATEAARRKVPIILVGPALVDEHKMDGDRATMTNLAYSNAVGKVARELEVPFIDLWHAFLESKGLKEGDPIPGKLGETTNQNLDDLLTDGVHFSGKGYRIWYDLLRETIRKEYPELRTENLATILPHISDVDNSDLPASLWRDVKVAEHITVLTMSPKRACDCCNIRKIKCEGGLPCGRCMANGLACTYLRERRRSGPRHLRQASMKIWKEQMALTQLKPDELPMSPPGVYQASPAADLQQIPTSVIRNVLSMYKESLYGIWPLLATDDLILRLESQTSDPTIYALTTALCGATLSNMSRTVMDESRQGALDAEAFIKECRRVRGTYDYMEPVTLDTVLTSYFLHIFYGRQASREQMAAFYIREAITFAHMFGMHLEDTYARYFTGFLNLVTLFSTPGRDFFGRWTSQGSNVTMSRDQLLLIQHALQRPLENPSYINDIQMVDIVVSQHWIRSLAWKLSVISGYVMPNGKREMNVEYPLEIAQHALRGVSQFSPAAFEVHGPGMEVKMYEIATALADSILCKPEEQSCLLVGRKDTLKSLTNFMSSLQVMNPGLRDVLAQKVEVILDSSSIPKSLELIEEDSPSSFEEDLLSTDFQLVNSMLYNDFLDLA